MYRSKNHKSCKIIIMICETLQLLVIKSEQFFPPLSNSFN